MSASSTLPPSLFTLLRTYRWPLGGLLLLTVISNGFNLVIPQLLAIAIDHPTEHLTPILGWLIVISGTTFVVAYLQNFGQVTLAERVARELRQRLANQIAQQDFRFLQTTSTASLLTNLTSDVEAVKNFVAQALVMMTSSVLMILGTSTWLLYLNWRLALAVLAVIPLIGGVFSFIFGRIRTLFKKAQEAIDWLNKVISESIWGAALIRVLNTQQPESEKFLAANTHAQSIGLNILRLFAGLIPAITFLTNLAILIILVFGGHLVISGTMSLGDFTAFNSYLALLIFPIIVIGFMSNVIAQATASFARLQQVLLAPPPTPRGTRQTALRGHIQVQNVTLRDGEKVILKELSLTITPGTRNAIIGPTAAGKTQLLYLLTGLLPPTSGAILYDGYPLTDYATTIIPQHLGIVFQDSQLFNLTLRENIAFGHQVTATDLQLAIHTAELSDLINQLPDGLDTVIAERGNSLSGGQKQRIMLARALALHPQILFLDDFTARVDIQTEAKILQNMAAAYPQLTLISITQKIAPIQNYDQIILLMEGELLAADTHSELMRHSPEYAQILQSQQSTNTL